MSDEAIVGLIGIGVMLLVGFVGWLAHVSYRLGRIYTLVSGKLRKHDLRFKVHHRRIRALEEPSSVQQAAS